MAHPPYPRSLPRAASRRLVAGALALAAGFAPAQSLTLGQMANPNGHYFAGYFPTWSDPWFSAYDAGGSLLPDNAIWTASLFAQLPGVYTHAMIAFAQPDFTWAGLAADTWTGTGIQFQSTPVNVKQAIRILHELGKRVILSVGGATYLDWSTLAAEAGKTGTPTKTALASCLTDLGLDGLDVDFEVAGADPATVTEYVGAIQALREAADAAGPGHLLCVAGWSTGADYTPATPTDAGYPGSYTYWGGNAGRERLAFKQTVPSGAYAGKPVASLFNLVDVMSYDAQTEHYDPVTAFDEYRFLVPATVPVSVGLEIPPEGWPGGILVISNSDAAAAGTLVVEDQYGRSPRGPYSVQRFGGHVLANTATPNVHDGMMLWDTGLTASVPAGAAMSANATTVAAEAAALYGYVPMPPSASVSVAVTPSSATLVPGGTQAFTAQVLGSTDTAVTWTCTGGTISAAGLFTAGSKNGAFTVTATSVADPTRKATAAVTISTPATVAVILAPAAVTLAPGATAQFTATVTGSSNQRVSWYCTGGSIWASGLYQAGSTAGSFTVTAIPVADTSRKAVAKVTIN